ncbi:MAG: hypothetical protein ACQESN_03480 [Thermotogota bacterium]
MKNLMFFIFILIIGVTVLSEDVAILTTKNGKILENYSVKSEESYGMTYYKLITKINNDNVMDLFFKQPSIMYDSISELIELEINEKYLDDKGISIEATPNISIENINGMVNYKEEQNQLLLKELKKENSLESYIESNKEEIKKNYDVFEVKKYEITESSTITTDLIEKTLKNSEAIKKYVVFDQDDLNNFSGFETINIDNLSVYYKENSIFTIKEIIDPMLFLKYDIKDDIVEEYEKHILAQWEKTYPNNFDFILVYKPLKVEDRINSIQLQNTEELQELKKFYTEIIFSEENIPEFWYLSYYNILDNLEELYNKEYENLNELNKNLPEEYFLKNYSQLQKITEESTNSTLTSYINNYKNFIYKNSEISSQDDYISYLNDFKDDLNQIQNEKNDILNIIIDKDYDFFHEVIREKFSNDIDSTYLFFYEKIFEYLKKREIDKESDSYSIIISNLEELKELKEPLVENIEELIVNIEEYTGMNQDE